MKIHCLAAAFAVAAAMPACADTLLNPIFQDHAVLQRGAPIRVWGNATPGASVSVGVSGQPSVTAQVGADGRWQAQLSAMTAGGPYSLTASSNGQTQTVNDVLVGDVYLCSGQSNMAFTVSGAIDAGPDIQVSANDTIRLMSVANQTSATPLTNIPTTQKWVAASPSTVAAFSAACYYFGRELQKSVHVPLGLINSSWGGANITSYMSAAAIKKAGGDDLRLAALEVYANDPAAGVKHWGEIVEDFWRNHNREAWNNPAESDHWHEAPHGLGIWSEWGYAPFNHYAGDTWFRTSVTLSAAQAAQAAQLSLGTVTEEDQTWVNGKFVAATFGYGQPRNYALPPGVLHDGVNDLLINDYCGWRGCGLFGPPEARAIHLADGTTVPLNGTWHVSIEPVTPPRVPWGATAGLTMAYNAMIAPLGPLGLKGVLWYQGESNTGDPGRYRTLLNAWMADWRSQFQAPSLPFLIVQLPDYGLPPIKPEDTDWARLRESQRLAAKDDSNAALVVTIDIGDHFGLHPGNKQEVGRRLAVAARHLIYGDATARTGPVPVGTAHAKGGVAVKFANFTGKLVAYNAADPIGFELCDARSCRFAKSTIRGDSVLLSAGRFAPTHVRYCWGDGPVCTLYDSARMPAVPFDIPVKAPSEHR